MSVYVITYEQGHKVARRVPSREEYLRLRGSAEQRKNVYLARQGDESAKRRLVQMNYSCRPADGVLRGCRTPSDTVGMDVDFDPADPDYGRKMTEVPRLVLSKKDELALRLLERSARKGYHIVFRRRPELTQEQNLQWAQRLLGVKYDAGAKDLTRVFFTTTDSPEDLLFLDDAIFETDSGGGSGSVCGSSAAVPVASPAAETVPEATSGAGPGVSWADSKAGVSEAGLEFSKTTPKASVVTSGSSLAAGASGVKDASVRALEAPDTEAKILKASAPDTETPALEVSVPGPGIPEAKNLGTEASEAETSEAAEAPEASEASEAAADSPLSYEGMPYPEIIGKWWELHNGGQTPVRSNRDTLTFELAVNLRHICGFDRQLLRRVIPCYDGFPEAERDKCIDSALETRRTQMPRRLREVLEAVRAEHTADGGVVQALDEAVEQDDLKQQDAIYLQQEADYRAQARRAKNERKQPEEPKLPVRLLTLNNTLANLSDRLANTGGRHAFSYTCEADLVAQKWRSALSDYSVMLRQAFDGSSFHREAKSAEAVNVHIDHLYWNVTMCGTQDALYRVIPNCTDGLLSRVALARTPDNTFARLEQRPPRLTAEQAARIRQTARVVGLMQGRVELARLEARSQQWTEAVRVAALKDNDRVMARCRMRDHVIAYRMTACLLLCAAAERMVREYGETGAVQRLTADPQAFAEWAVRSQTPAMLEAYDALADSLLENDLHFFRERIERAYNGDDYRTPPASEGRVRKGKNDSIFARLPQEFSFEQALQACRSVRGDMSVNAVRQMLKNWRAQGLAEGKGTAWRKAEGL